MSVVVSAVVVGAVFATTAYTSHAQRKATNKVARAQREETQRAKTEAEAQRVANKLDKQASAKDVPTVRTNSSRSSYSTGIRKAATPVGVSQSLGV